MQRAHVFLTVVLCLLLTRSTAAQQREPISVTFVNQSADGSPLEVTGQVVLEESLKGNELEWAWGEKVVAKNASGKPIVLFVATLGLRGRHNRGSLRGPGDGPTYVLSEDRFFSKDIISPGDTLVLRDTKPDNPSHECCVNPVDRPAEPTAEFQVHFVQFLDGSTFGDRSAAEESLALRATIMKGLREFEKSYRKTGEGVFVAAAKQPASWSNTSVFGDIWAIYEGSGAEAAMARTRQIIAIAAEHETSMRHTAVNTPRD